jgi:hypothetical protein
MRVGIETAEHAAAVRDELEALEQRFRAGADPGVSRALAREIIRLRMSLTSYALRQGAPEAYEERLG